MPRPYSPKIYHITHLSNLQSIVQLGELRPNSTMNTQVRPELVDIGMAAIKIRRASLPVTCFPGDRVGQYVPFYFCPRSPMLFVIRCQNNSDLSYNGGQEPIVHLEADLNQVVEWARLNHRRWAFSLSNAGAVYSEFRSTHEALDELKWDAIQARDFRSVKEHKQAEFLVKTDFPWFLIERVGVLSKEAVGKVREIVGNSSIVPGIQVMPDWYF
jgi:hypothetical protein